MVTEHGYSPANGGSHETAADATDTTGQFAAETMTATVDDGKVYWKVKGGVYRKFGIIVWPEVLEDAGFVVDELNPLKQIDLVGWTAVFSVKENGQPHKVIKLSRAEK